MEIVMYYVLYYSTHTTTYIMARTSICIDTV